jgi:hypothetical protein
MTMLEGERTFVILPLISKIKFVVFISVPADVGNSEKLKTIKIRASPIFKKNHQIMYLTALRNSFG